MREFKSLINGKLVPGVARLDVINPATEEVLAEAPRADRAQLNEAIAAAKAAFPAWSAKPIRERGALLVKLADALEARQDEFARLLTLEQGKPLPEAHWEIGFTIAHYSPPRDARSAKQSLEGRRNAKNRAALHAARRGRGDCAVELPDAPARHQGGTGAACRQHAGREAGANDAADDAPARGDLWRDPARGRDQRHRRSQ